MQCFPMAIANSLQYLENRNAFFSVPHDHVPGLYGDDSLVGQLDLYAGRETTSRMSGPGVWFVPMMEGKFEYLAENGLANRLVHKHQGYGYGGAGNQLPPGDFTHAGITSKDEGGKVTFDWIEEQLRSCEDVEVVKDGHAVRVFGCGKNLGKPYLRYKHDGWQSNDANGLDEVQVYVEDLDGDGMMNWGAGSQEIWFALSESVKPIILILDPVFLQLAIVRIRIINTLEQDLREVKWSIDVEGLVFLGDHTEGTINLPAGKEEVISSNLVFGLGPAAVTVEVDAVYHTSVKGSCFLFGPLAINLREA